MSTQPNRRNKSSAQGAAAPSSEPLPTDPLPPETARRAEEEAREHALLVSEEAIESRRRGRIEAETWRISEEVTRAAQERMRADRDTVAPTPTDTLATSADVHHVIVPDVGGVAVVAHQIRLPAPTPVTHILVPLDGTPYGERALPFAGAVARMTAADITLLHVTRHPAGDNALDTVSNAVDHRITGARSESIADPVGYLLAVQAQLAQQGVEAQCMCIAASSPQDGIELVMEQVHADLVMLATHAREGMERRLLGSVGDHLVQRGGVPVLLIPPSANAPGKPGAADAALPFFSQVLVPLDGSATAEQALGPVLALAEQAEKRAHLPMHIVLFHVAESRTLRPDGVRYVNEVKERMVARGLPATVDVTAAAAVGSPPGAIVGAAKHGIMNVQDYPAPFDLVVMATHGRGGMQRWLYGSVAAYILPRIEIPVVLVHPTGHHGSDM